MTTIPFTFTNESITVILDGSPRTVHKGSAQYPALKQALFNEEWDQIASLVTVAGALQRFFKGTPFIVDMSGAMKFADGSPEHLDVPESISRRIRAMAVGGEDPIALINFYKRLARNPSYRSRMQLFDFLAHMGIPIEPDGTFLAYKGVKEDMRDVHSGKFDNSPGQIHRMPRNQISDDPDVDCHVGFHVGALSYARNFGPVHVICRVDPEHVVSVPKDESCRKMRVCEYAVIGLWNGEEMPSTTYTADVTSEPDPEMDAEIEDDAGDADDWTPIAEDGSQLDHIEERNRETARQIDSLNDSLKTNKPIKKIVTKATQLGRLTPAKLMERSIDELRKYASGSLKIVGASKMSGGKTSLVAAILKARRRKRR
jgi:hypothetical protein